MRKNEQKQRWMKMKKENEKEKKEGKKEIKNFIEFYHHEKQGEDIEPQIQVTAPTIHQATLLKGYKQYKEEKNEKEGKKERVNLDPVLKKQATPKSKAMKGKGTSGERKDFPPKVKQQPEMKEKTVGFSTKSGKGKGSQQVEKPNMKVLEQGMTMKGKELTTKKKDRAEEIYEENVKALQEYKKRKQESKENKQKETTKETSEEYEQNMKALQKYVDAFTVVRGPQKEGKEGIQKVEDKGETVFQRWGDPSCQIQGMSQGKESDPKGEKKKPFHPSDHENFTEGLKAYEEFAKSVEKEKKEKKGKGKGDGGKKVSPYKRGSWRQQQDYEIQEGKEEMGEEFF